VNPSSPDAALVAELSHLQRLARALVADPALADDLVQDTLLVSLTRRSRRVADLRAWLRAVMRHRLRRHARREAARAAVEARAARADAQPAAAEVAAVAALHQQLSAEVAALPEPYRASVVLRFLQDLDVAEVARRTAVPLETARARIRRGLALLRERLDARCGGRSWAMALAALPRRATPGAVARLMVVAAALVAGLCGGLWWLSEAPASAQLGAGAAGAVTDAAAVAVPMLAPNRTPLPRPMVVAAASAELVGSVVEQSARLPVAAARVVLLREPADDFDGLPPTAPEPERVAATSTDPEGGFRFAVVRGQLYRVEVVAPGLASRTMFACSAERECRVVLSRAAALHCRVRRAGQPVAQAVIEVEAVLQHAAQDARGMPARALTSADGLFRGEDLGAGLVGVSVSAPGAVDVYVQTELVAGERRELTVELASGRTARGRVRDAASGQPIAGARVAADPALSRSVATDGEGRFALDVLPEQGAWLHVDAPGRAARRQPLPSGRGDVAVDVELEREAAVVGALLDADGRPIAGARLHLGGYPGGGPPDAGQVHPEFHGAAADGAGRVRVSGLVPGVSYQVLAFAPARGAFVGSLARPLVAGEELDVGAVRLSVAGVIEGVVVDAAGHPVAGVEVALRRTAPLAILRPELRGAAGPPQSDREFFAFSLRPRPTSSDGRFSFAGLEPGAYALAVALPGQRQAMLQVDVTVTTGQLIDVGALRVARGLTIAGRIARPVGVAPGVVIALQAFRPDGLGAYADVAADGRFEFVDLKPGTYHLSALRSPSGWALPPVLDVPAGGTPLTLAFVPAATIVGRVLDAQGQPVASAAVAAVSVPNIRSRIPTERTDAEGRFVLEVEPTFVGRVTAKSDDAKATLDGAAAGAREVVLRLR
jgi:RNA polymerase sigma-70 factor (ECF subfamily)